MFHMEQSVQTVTVTVSAVLTQAEKVYKRRRDWQREYMRQYRQGKRRKQK